MDLKFCFCLVRWASTQVSEERSMQKVIKHLYSGEGSCTEAIMVMQIKLVVVAVFLRSMTNLVA